MSSSAASSASVFSEGAFSFTGAAGAGAGQEEADPQKPYWKGGLSERQALQTRKEREEFAGAVDAILAGRYDEGGAKLDEFGKAHPASKYLNDVKDARAKLEELRAHGAVAEEPAPAPAPAPETIGAVSSPGIEVPDDLFDDPGDAKG